MTQGEAVKVWLTEGEHVESLWATRVGPHEYRLDNSPWFAYGVSWEDVVEAQPAPDGTLAVVGVVRRSGRRTIRVFFSESNAEQSRIDEILAAVAALGLTFEGMNRIYFALDAAPDVALGPVVRFLTQEGVQWEYANPELAEVEPRDRLVPG